MSQKKQYADIIIDISQEQLDKTFQYKIPETMMETIVPGTLVCVPFGRGKRTMTGYVVSLSDEPKVEPERIKEIIGIPKNAMTIESQLIALAYWMKTHYGSTMNQALKTVIPIKKKTVAVHKKLIHFQLDQVTAQEELVQLLNRKNHSIAKERLLQALMEEGTIPWDVLTDKLDIPSVHIRDFEKKGWIVIESSRSYRNPKITYEMQGKQFFLNDLQQSAAARFQKDYQHQLYRTYLLYGVTGSGKTEVYMEMIATVLSAGKDAIVLIPEIALTYQTLMRFYRRFGEKVSIIHSKMSAGERSDQFELAKAGKVKVMVGPRSALFTPFENLGLIIIDEEHDMAYKSEQVPRYHARETAIERARLAQASVVLGSATPSMESYTLAKKGEYVLLTLPERAAQKDMAECEIIDLREELRLGNRSILSKRLQELLSDRLQKKQQSMLFLNRRGLMGFVSCRACGHVIKCPHCDVSMSLHRDGNLHCHYCGYQQDMPKKCPSCDSTYIGSFKAGTEKMEQMVSQLFPEARILRMDGDTTKGKNAHQEILARFANQEADILIGTQMIVKGHDFSNVTLMGILAADMSLNATDYRCGERTFDLLTQAAGRAGRGDLPGKVIIQTYQPDHYAILSAAKQDYEQFYVQEMAYRTLMHYPPVAHLLALLITSQQKNIACEVSKKIADTIADSFHNIVILGPKDAAISKLSDIYRQEIFLKALSWNELIEVKDVLEQEMKNNMLYRKVNIWFDFDPMNGF